MIVKGLNIFLTWKQYDQILNDKVKKEISNIPFKMPDQFDKYIKAENKIIYDEVKRQMCRLEKAFEFKEFWMKFDISGIEAKQNTLNLIEDYSQLRKNIVLQDNRIQYITKDYEFERYYRLGKEFSLIYKIPKIKNWYGKVLQSPNEIEIKIDTQKVTRLEGKFNSVFTIYFENQKIVFGGGISISNF